MTADCLARLPPRFVRWKAIPRPDGKTEKVPCDAHGLPIDPHDPRNWLPREACGDRVGFVLNGDGYFFLDLDSCSQAGVWSPQALAIHSMFPGAACEVSSSGQGLHILGRCDVAALAAKRNRWDGWLECYTNKRVVAFGPHGWQGDPEIDHTAALLRLVPDRPPPLAEAAGAGTSPVEDDVVLERMLKAQRAAARFGAGGVTPADLWHARADVLAAAYPSAAPGQPYDRSAADAAFMAHLAFWCGRDPAQMDRLFRRSGLMRDKYERREDYRDSTVRGAIGITRNVATWSTPAVVGEPTGEAAALRAYLTVADQLTHFEGCTYVTSAHAILTPTGRLLTPERFNARYGGHEFAMQADGAKPTKKAFEAFTESRAHRFPSVDTTTFRPDRMFGEVIGDAVNIYKPADVASVPGDVTPFLDHLARLLPLESDRATLLQYMACVVQRPGYKVKWAPVVQGCEGNGKTFLVDCLREAIGRQYVHTARSEELSEKYNDYVEHNLLVVVEEVDTRDRRDVMNVLKPLITNMDTEIRSMGVAKRKGRTYANFFFCCNPRDAIVKARGDRRYAIFYTAQQDEPDLERDGMTSEYFTHLYDWAQAGGYAHVTHWLTQRDVSAIPSRAPVTSSTEAAIAESMGGAEMAVMDAIEEGRPGTRGGWLSSWTAANVVERATGRMPSPKLLGMIIRNLGYREIMKSPILIMQEGGKQPKLYAKDDRPKNYEDYARAQGYLPNFMPLHIVR